MNALACALFVGAAVVAAADASADPADDCSSQGAARRLPALTLDVNLATAVALPPSAKQSLMREVEGIWCREGVRVRWVATPEAPGTSSIRVIVVRWGLAHDAGEGHTWPVGKLAGVGSATATALVSMAAAQRTVVSANRSGGPMSLADHRLGVVLGRAVAHEIGHCLLGRSHARHGLMRAHIAATDFADLRAGGFYLDGPGAARAREVLARRMTGDRRIARATAGHPDRL